MCVHALASVLVPLLRLFLFAVSFSRYLARLAWLFISSEIVCQSHLRHSRHARSLLGPAAWRVGLFKVPQVPQHRPARRRETDRWTDRQGETETETETETEIDTDIGRHRQTHTTAAC